MPPFRLGHIPPLLLATAFTIGGAMPLWNPSGAIREFGLPERIAVSGPAQAYAVVYGSRMTLIGLAIWIFYLRGMLQAVDVLVGLMVYAGLVDAWICWREGVVGVAWFRALSGVVVGAWGILGLTAG